jgi:hypothetical protein
MGLAKTPIDRDVYLKSLVWRQAEIRSRLETLRSQLQAFQREEAELMQEVRAIDLLLGAAKVNGSLVQSKAEPSAEGSDSASQELPDFSAWGPTAREIYQCTYKVILDAGVPMHYRVLAEHVRERVQLSGADPGATLIAHLHRAQEIFPRVGRGVYGIAGMVNKPAIERIGAEPGVPPRKRRQRVRRRRVK